MLTPHPIYLLRHGRTVWNEEGRMQGRLDSPLTDIGREQAARMAETLAALIEGKTCQMVTSPQPRALATAAIIAQRCRLSPVQEPRLREIDLGAWEGKTWAEIDRQFPYAIGLPDRNFHGPGGETYDDVAARAKAWMQELTSPTVAVSHGITGRVIRALYAGIPERDLPAVARSTQDGLFRLEQGTVAFIECIQPCETDPR